MTPRAAPASVQSPIHSRGMLPRSRRQPATEVEQSSVGAAAALVRMSAPEADVRRKAQRFARLPADEINLYNQAQLVEGRKNQDLYDRLKQDQDIDKRRSTNQKRQGAEPARWTISESN